MSNFQEFIVFQKRLLKVLLTGLIICMIFRIVFMFRFGDISTLKDHVSDFGRLFFTGFRFDLHILAYLLLPCYILSFFLLAIKSQRFIKFLNKFLLYYVSVLYTIIAFALLADQQFYSNFKQHYNIVLFDFFHEEPLILIRSIWDEHPVLLVFFITAVVYYSIYRLTKRIIAKSKYPSKKYPLLVKLLIVLFIMGIYVISMRGSLGTFPIQLKIVNVSDDEFINHCVPNAIFMLKEAHKEAKFNFAADTEQSICKRYGFASLEEALSVYYSIPVDSVKKHPLEYWVYKTTPTKDSIDYPNVLFIMVESWSNHLINFHTEQANLLCTMKPHLEQDVLFRNFQSASNGTLTSLESIILGSPYHPIFDSKYRFISFPSSIAKTFQEAGYEAGFVTGIHLDWRHLNEALPKQHFDKVIGKYGVLKDNPEAKSNNTWGVYDHYVLDYIYELLHSAEKPQFMLCLTSTSHTPFELPPDYELPPLKLTEDALNQFSVDEDITYNYLQAYQYSNKMLGDFMNKIKNSKLAENTIIIITGDHNIRSVLPYNTKEVAKYKNSVPLYIYLPEHIRKGLIVDTQRWASHYDIMPSIIPLILSDARYFSLDQNVFDTTKNTLYYYSINDYSIMHNEGLTDEQAVRLVKARHTIAACYFNTIFNGIETGKLLEKQK